MHLVEEFDQLWDSADAPPDLPSFLQQQTTVDSEQWLAVLLSDQKRRWLTSSPLRVEDYLASLPDLPGGVDWKLQLAVGEFEARRDTERPLSQDEISSRFPEIGDTLRDKLFQADSGSDEDRRLQHATTHFSGIVAGKSFVGRYRLLRVLGEGAFGRVCLGIDDELQREVAIKMPTAERFQKPEDADQYLAEARTVAGLDHPHIVPVYDMGRTGDGSIYVVSKFVEGGTLEDRIRNDRPDERETAGLLATIALALQHAHERRLIHRDIKPANLLMEERTKTPYVADFGLAIREEDVLRENAIAGTPAYMSPEQASGEGHRLDGRSDIFSLGVVLYELLTGTKPFRGSSTLDTLQQIISQNPRPPRELVDTISAELERICLKTLSKRASDRYATAAELADDLEQWLKPKAAGSPTDMVAQVVPRGLRSFDAGDADFFPDLLPGQRNRDGLPESIAFWKKAFEDTDPEQTFSVGLIYGPSGCGKSSLVRAGLLPYLSDSVIAVYVEATPDETETRILRGLRKRLPELSEDAGLTDTLAAVRRAQGGKVVIIIDQFEQWLHAHSAAPDAELVKALRQCDGGRLQAVVMVRDDFSMAASRFMRSLDTRLVEGHNFAAVDLFDLDHARKVLVKFGQAFGKLPANTGHLSDAERQFVDGVASGLSQDDRVVSVRLALFAEMVKGKPWVPATLEDVGGTSGVGVNFLEETFSTSRANPDHRLHQQAARDVLNSLLPDVGSDIKGHMKSHAELLNVSGYRARPRDFADLLRILDGELRLITPTDPAGADTQSGSSDPAAKFYQLTHDYLVPSLQTWLTRKQQETRKGRAELKLAERTALWTAKPENRHLPSLMEWAGIRTLTEKKHWTDLQQKLMKRAASVHGLRSVMAIAVACVMTAAGVGFTRQADERRNQAESERLVDGLLTADTAVVRGPIEKLKGFRTWADPLLWQAFNESPEDSNAHLHAGLALVAPGQTVHQNVLDLLRKRLLTVTPTQFEYVRDLLNDNKDELVNDYWQHARESQSPDLRFQAACILASYDPENEEWQNKELGTFVAGHLVRVRPSELLPWTNALRPVRDFLIGPLSTIYRNPDAGEQIRSFATEILADYLSNDTEGLFDLLADSDEQQFGTIFDKLTNDRTNAVLLGNAEVAKHSAKDATVSDRESLAKRQANAAAMLLRMNAPDQVWPLLKQSPNPQVRSRIIHSLGTHGADPETITDRFAEEPDATIRSALLLCLGEFDESRISDGQRRTLIQTLLDVYRSAPDGGVHGAAEWLLRQWGQGERLAAIDVDLRQSEADLQSAADMTRQWYINGLGQTFVIVEMGEFQRGSPEGEAGRDEKKENLRRVNIDRRIAIGTKEVTCGQLGELLPQSTAESITEKNSPHPLDVSSSPTRNQTWYDAVKFCNQLSKQEGISEEQWCYIPNPSGEYAEGMEVKENFLELTGYRLPTAPEWEYACRAHSVCSRYYGSSLRLLSQYAWYALNSDSQRHPAGRLKPNNFGLFDMHGNVNEWCHDINVTPSDASNAGSEDLCHVGSVLNADERVLRGGSFQDIASFQRSADVNSNNPDAINKSNGFRVVRTYHLSRLNP